ncbi:MAG: hypothetical protein ACREP2_05825 [Rhodanobacteraceae bacterium]
MKVDGGLPIPRGLATLRRMQTGKSRPRGRRQAFAVALGCAFALILTACHHPPPPPPSNVTPTKAVATNLRLTAAGDFDGLMRNRLPAADYAAWRAQWDKQHAHAVPASVAEQDQFRKVMQMLTEPGAEDKLAKRLKPELARLHGKGGDMPILAGIVDAAGKQMIVESPQLGAAQRTLATQALDAVIAWARSVDFSDPSKARKAIDLVCATARQLHVQTLDQWRALDYAATMADYGIIWNALEKLLDLYGLDLTRALNQAKVASTGHGDNRATVRLDLNLAGKSLTAEWPMVKQDNHWYDEALLEAWRKSHPAPAPSGSSAAASGATSAAKPPAAATLTTPASARS